MPSEGIGGLTATTEVVIVGSRDATDTQDLFTCHSIEDGSEIWRFSYPAPGRLDYGNSPRAAATIFQGNVLLLGALGQLSCLELATGELRWQRHLAMEWQAQPPTWGFCGSPIVLAPPNVETPICVVQPGAKDASLIAFGINDGSIKWLSPGRGASYSSLIVGKTAAGPQLIGFDATSLGGWSLKGERLWERIPKKSGDFNVPTPIMVKDRLFITTENNGSLLFEFDVDGRLVHRPLATNQRLAPDTHSPVVVGDLICGIYQGLVCLSKKDLQLVHLLEDPALADYAAILSDGQERVLVATLDAQLILARVTPDQCQIVDRLRLAEDSELMSHPAIVGDNLIVRFGRTLACLKM